MQQTPKQTTPKTPTKDPQSETSRVPTEQLRGMDFEEGQSLLAPKEETRDQPKKREAQPSSLEAFRKSPTKKVDELTLLFGSREAVVTQLASSIGPDCATIAGWQKAEVERGKWDLGELDVKKPAIVDALAKLAAGLTEGGFDWPSWYLDSSPIGKALESDPSLFETVANVVGTSCGDIVNGLRPIMLSGRGEHARGMEGVHTALISNTLTDQGQHIKKPVPEVEGVLSGVGPASLREAMLGETSPLYVQVYLGRAHTYALEQVARKTTSDALRGYRYEAFFGAHSMATFVKNQPEGDIDLGEHLDDLDTYCTTEKQPEKEALRERVLAREWSTTTVKGLEEKAKKLTRLGELESQAKSGELSVEDEKERKGLVREYDKYNGDVRALSPEDVKVLETARGVLESEETAGELTHEEAETLGKYLETQKATYAKMFFHKDDDKVDLKWQHERRQLTWTATVFDPVAAKGALKDRTGHG